MNIKLNEKILNQTKFVSKLRGEGYSDFVRIAIAERLARLGFLTIKERKALGVKT